MSNIIPSDGDLTSLTQQKIYGPSKLADAAPGEKSYLSISGHFLPLSKATGHSLTLGMAGTGKTHLMRASMGFAASTLSPGMGSLIDFDAKGEDYPILKYFADKQKVPLFFINLGDSRSNALDIAKDSEGYPDYLWEQVQLLVPEEGSEQNPFFTRSVQGILFACMLALVERQQLNWGFHDVYNLALNKTEILQKFLQETPQAVQILERLFMSQAKDTISNIGSSLLVELQKLRPLAAHQYHTPKDRWISLGEILSQGGILLVGRDPLAKSSSNVVTQLIFRNLYNRIEDLLDDSGKRIHVYIDELASFGRVHYLEDFLATTRSRGAMLHMASQSWGKLVEMYGENIAWTILGNCDYHTVLRCDPQTADVAVKLFGKHKTFKKSMQLQIQNGLLSHNFGLDEEIRDRYQHSEFTDLRKASESEGINFFFKSDLRGIRRVRIPPNWVEEMCKLPKAENTPRRVKKTPEQTTFPMWDPGAGLKISNKVRSNSSQVDPSMNYFFQFMQEAEELV